MWGKERAMRTKGVRMAAGVRRERVEGSREKKPTEKRSMIKPMTVKR